MLDHDHQESTRTIQISIAGVPGAFDFTRWGVCARGNWASHTGFRSIDHSDWSSLPIERLQEFSKDWASRTYEVSKSWAFAVGDDHEGWSKIRYNLDGRLELRLPDWHEGVVLQELERYGFVLTDKLNCLAVAPHDLTAEQARTLAKPLYGKSTRFESEVILARAIAVQAEAAGLLPDLEAGGRSIQIGLFDV